LSPALLRKAPLYPSGAFLRLEMLLAASNAQ